MYLLTFLGPYWFPVYNERTTTKTTDQIVVVLLLLLLLRKTRTHLQNNPFVLLYNSAQINWFNGEIFCVYTLIQLAIFGWKVGNFIFFRLVFDCIPIVEPIQELYWQVKKVAIFAWNIYREATICDRHRRERRYFNYMASNRNSYGFRIDPSHN